MQSTDTSDRQQGLDTAHHVEVVPPYYEWLRTDVLASVPASAQTVLSVGCGAGVTEAVLVEAGKDVVGIEFCPEAAAKARARGIDVIEGDVASVSVLLRGRSFDCLIYADVLEHLVAPEEVLMGHSSCLTHGGTVIVSIPNFRHWSVAWAIFIHGEFRYQQAGIFDKTHLRITTRKSVERWFKSLGLEIVQVKYGIPSRRAKLLSRITGGLLREYLSTQILVVGKSANTANAVK